MPSGVYKRTIAQRKMYSERIMGNKNPSKRLEVIQKIKQTRIKIILINIH